MGDDRATARLRAVVLALAAALVALLAPTLAGVDGTTTLTGTLLAVAVAALFAAAHETAAWHARTASGRHETGRPVPLVLTTRATDPVHHPLRPRAPGRD